MYVLYICIYTTPLRAYLCWPALHYAMRRNICHGPSCNFDNSHARSAPPWMHKCVKFKHVTRSAPLSLLLLLLLGQSCCPVVAKMCVEFEYLSGCSNRKCQQTTQQRATSPSSINFSEKLKEIYTLYNPICTMSRHVAQHMGVFPFGNMSTRLRIYVICSIAKRHVNNLLPSMRFHAWKLRMPHIYACVSYMSCVGLWVCSFGSPPPQKLYHMILETQRA